tara:strand:- start:3045 stop:3407 length:363 start_codon:yes stop_codon:yes gene_type:complete
MRVLIVESRPELGSLWENHLSRQGMDVVVAANQDAAIRHLASRDVEIIILDVVLSEGSALNVADYANYRHPAARVIFVSSSSFFSDGSIFAHAANARVFVPAGTPPEDLAAMVEHYGNRP